jgi:tetratricopeptide (TPR) repeat protein
MNMKNAMYGMIFLSVQSLNAQKSHRNLRQGEKNYESKNWSAAKKDFLEAGNSFAALYNAGDAAYQSDANEEAVSFFEKASECTQSKTEKSDALYNLGNAFLRLGQYQKAITAFENSLRLTANRPDTQKNLQIAKKKLSTPPPKPKPPPPPPPIVASQQRYLDQAPTSPHREKPSGNIPENEAKKILEAIVVPDEQRNVRAYRELAPAVRATRAKDW